MLSKALLGLSLLGTGANAAPQFELPDPPKVVAQQQQNQSEPIVLAATLVLEAGGETKQKAMIGVFNVLQNRAKKSKSSEYTEAIKPLQFSCWNKGEYEGMSRSDRIKMAQKHPNWGLATEIVRRGLSGELEDVTKGATHYHVWRGKNKVSPDWTVIGLGGKNKKAKIAKTIGNHVFLKNVD